MGRFIQRDSLVGQLQNPQSLNRYVYAGNNPVNYTDPSGLWQLEAEFYLTYGGGLAFGKNPDTEWYRGWFLRLRAGAGIGGGVAYDPSGASPNYDKSGGFQINAGGFADAGLNFGPLGVGTSTGAGTYADTNCDTDNLLNYYKYFSPPVPKFNFEAEGEKAVASVGAEGYLTW